VDINNNRYEPDVRRVLAKDLGVDESQLYVYSYLSGCTISASGAISVSNIMPYLDDFSNKIISRYISNPKISPEGERALSLALKEKTVDRELYEIGLGLALGRLIKVVVSPLFQKFLKSKDGESLSHNREDVLAEIIIKLMEILPKFDPEKGAITTFAVRYVTETIADYLKSLNGVKDNEASIISIYNKGKEALIQCGIQDPTVEQIAAWAKEKGKNITEQRFEKILAGRHETVSLYVPNPEDPSEEMVNPEAEHSQDKRFQTPEEVMFNKNVREAIIDAAEMTARTDAERAVICELLDRMENSEKVYELTKDQALDIGRQVFGSMLNDVEILQTVFSLRRSLARNYQKIDKDKAKRNKEIATLCFGTPKEDMEEEVRNIQDNIDIIWQELDFGEDF